MQIPLSSITVLLTSLAFGASQCTVEGCTTTSSSTGLIPSGACSTSTFYLETVTQTSSADCHGCTAIVVEPQIFNCPLITSRASVTKPVETETHWVCSATPAAMPAYGYDQECCDE